MAIPTPTAAPTRTSSSTSTATCTTAVPDKYGHVPIDACDSYYSFYPSFEGNMAFAVLFGVSTLVHLAQAVAYKKRFCWVIVMGGIWETAAFIIRTIGAHDQQQMQYAIWGLLLFLLAPLWINAFAYMTVARMVHFALPEQRIWGVRAAKLTLIFIWLDVVCFLVQAGGGALLSGDNPANLLAIGMKVYMAGIGVQMGFVVIFSAMTLWFYYRVHQVAGGGGIGRMRYLIWTLLAVLLLIVGRITYRLVEFGPGIGNDNPILTHENYPFLLDAFPMLLALTLLNACHPGLVLRGPDSEFPRLTRAEKKALKQRKRDEKRRRKEEKKRGGRKDSEYVLTEDLRRTTTGSESEWERHDRV